MTKIKTYIKNGEKYYFFKCYLGKGKGKGKYKYATRRNFKTKSEAQKALIKLKYDYNHNNHQVPGKETFLDIYNLWIKQYERDVEKSTLKKTKGIFNNHILPAIGQSLISNLTPLECQKHVNMWAERLKKAKIIKSYASMVMNFAIKYEYISSNPFLVVNVPKRRAKVHEIVEQDENFYTKEQLTEFLTKLKEYNNPKLYAFFRLLAYSGMRKGEAFALQWLDINFDKKTITINKALSQDENNNLYVKCTKTGKPRVIPIDEDTLEILKKWRKIQSEEYGTLGFNTLNQKQLLFSNLKNTHIQPSVTSRWLNEFYSEYNWLPRISTHGFRHTHCTLLKEAKVDPKEIQQRLGHSNLQTTLGTYTHVLEEGKKDCMQKFVSYITV